MAIQIFGVLVYAIFIQLFQYITNINAHTCGNVNNLSEAVRLVTQIDGSSFLFEGNLMAILAVNGGPQLRLVKPLESLDAEQPPRSQQEALAPGHFGRTDSVLKEAAARVRAGFDRIYSPKPESNESLKARDKLPQSVWEAVVAFRSTAVSAATKQGSLLEAAQSVGLS